MKSLLLSAALGAALVGLSRAAAQEPAGPAAERPRPPVRVGTLSNGLRIFCRTNDASEIVAVVCLVRAGLPDEREEQAGLAALTAEALLKGTTTTTKSSFNKALLKAGGNLRTLPGFDFTEISIVCSREQFEDAIRLLGDVVAHPRFSPEEVQEAREAVKRRSEGIQDDFTGASYQNLTSQLYPTSPYGRAIAGYAHTLDRLTHADVRRFWETTYSQNRMWVAVVGDVDSNKALAVAQKAFVDVPFRPGAVTPRPPVLPLDRDRLELLRRPGPAAQLMAGFLAPGATRQNYPVYALLDGVIGGGKRARLFQNIREKENLGYETGSFYQPLLYQSHLVGYVVTPQYRLNPRTEQPEDVTEMVRNRLLEQYRQLALTGPTDQEMARAKAYVIGRYALRQERTRDQAKWLAWNEAMGLSRDFDQQFPALVQAVTKEQVQQAAKQSLARHALVVTLPEGRGM
jgi:zinc protease